MNKPKHTFKIFIIVIFILLCSAKLFAQTQYATTTEGRKVILKADGTWKYVDETVNRFSSSSNNTSSTATRKSYSSSKPSKQSNRRNYTRGPRGGCYYVNSSGNKTYVDRSLCD